MKRFSSCLFLLALALSLVACGASTETELPTQETTASTIPVTEVTEPGEVTQPVLEVPATEPETIQQSQPVQTTEPAVTEPQPSEVQPSESKPTESKPAESNPSESKPVETKPSESEPPEATPTAPQPSVTQPSNSGSHVHNYNYRIEKTYTYCYEKGYEYFICACGQRLYSIHNPSDHWLSGTVITAATHDKEGLEDVRCSRCPYTGTRVIPKVDVPYFVGFEILSVERPNAYYLSNGQDLLTRLYGKNQAFQLGDSMVVRVNMSDGGSDFKLSYFHDCVVRQEGNLLYILFDTEYPAFQRQSSFTIEVNDRDGIRQNEGMIFDLCCQSGNLGEGTACSSELRKYGVRLGMKWITNGTDFLEKYNGGYTWNDPSLSLTGCTIQGTDDLIPIEGNPNWIEQAINLLDTYKSMGFTIFTIHAGYSFTTLAE